MIIRILATPLLLSLLLLTISACSSDGDGDSTVADVDLSFSDAAVDNVYEVVISVERITFSRGDEAEDIVVDTFVSDESDTGAETYTLDLLTVQGEDRKLVIDSVELPVGEYSNMLIEVVDESLDASYVVDDGGRKLLKVPSNILRLGGFTIEPTSTQSMVVEFGLQQSMTYNPGPDRYILKPNGVRIVSVDQAALVTGDINHTALQVNETCAALELGGTAGNIYLYAGHSLTAESMADNFNIEVASNAEGFIAPIASSSLANNTFSLSYLEAGDYTLAVSCHEEADDADQLQQLGIPDPPGQIVEFSINIGQTLSCAIPLGEEGCVATDVSTDIEN